MSEQFLQQEFEVNKTADYWNTDIQILKQAQRIMRREGMMPKTQVLSKVRSREVPEGEEGTFEVVFEIYDPRTVTPYLQGTILAFVLYDYPKEGRILIESIAFTDLKRV